MKLSRNYLIGALMVMALYLMFFKPRTSGWCFGFCTGWKVVSNSSTYQCPSDKPNKKIGLGGQQVNCCKCP